MMQPSFLPWQGYFELIFRADRFVLCDDYQLSIASYHQRNRLFVDVDSVGWYTVPMQSKRSFGMSLNQTHICERGRWRQKLWRRMRQNYSKAPFYSLIAPRVENWIFTPAESLADQNIGFVRLACELMGIEREFRLSSQHPSDLPRSARAEDLLRWCNADQFLSARGSFGYLKSDGLFPIDGICTLFQDFRPRSYPQVGSRQGFVPSLSVLDALFNVGTAATLDLIVGGTKKWWTWDEMLAVEREPSGHSDEPGMEEV